MPNNSNQKPRQQTQNTYGSNALNQSQQRYQNNNRIDLNPNNIQYSDPTDLNNILTLEKAIQRKQQMISEQNEEDPVNKNSQKKYPNYQKKTNSSGQSFTDKIINWIDNKIFSKNKNKSDNSSQENIVQTVSYTNQSHNQITSIPANERRYVETTRDLLYRQDVSAIDKIAPSSLEVDFNDIKINDTYVRTIFVTDYKKAYPGLLESLINYEEPIDIAMYYYPISTKDIVDKIRRKIAELEAQLNLELEGGRVPNAYAKVALQDALRQQEELASGAEKYFHFGLYITIKAQTMQALNNLTSVVISDLSSKEMTTKIPTLKMENAFKSSLPYAFDRIRTTRNMDTSSIAMTFPFTSSDLSQEKGILYGINTYNRGLVVFDRFSMPNANMVVLASSGGGKSYFVKLEVLRSLMLGTECIVIDPENEYEELAKTVGGAYVSFSQDGKNKLNPFELPAGADSNEDELRLKELSLQGFFKILFGSMSTRGTAILDRAIRMAYREKGISNDKATFVNEPPRMEDLYKTLRAMEEGEAQEMALKLERFLVGSAAGIFDKRTNIEIINSFTVFSIRDLSEELRPLAMYLMLDFIWTKIKRERKRRILAIDEAWILMKYPDSALFINSVAKRARKYYLGLTTITQDVSDFLGTDYGRAIVTNSSIQILFRQSPVALQTLGSTFDLSEGEKAYLQSVPPGQGLFFAGNNHVSIDVKASPTEHAIVTSNPIELENLKKQGVI
jgi:hypothetical protein